VDYHEWQGTRDMSPFLAVPDAIRFQQAHEWDQVRARSHALALSTRDRINALTGQPAIAPPDWLGQMAAVLLPPEADPEALHRRLWEEHRIEIPAFWWHDRPLLRISFQGYNDESDADALLRALELAL
jgi:isopenicillin-N epimerase